MGAALIVIDMLNPYEHEDAERLMASVSEAVPSLIELIAPPDDVPFIVKARHSVFYETQLEYLLRQEGVDRLLLSGQVTEQCILYSALDAYVRHFEVVIPRTAVAHIQEDLAHAAMRMMAENMRAEIADSPAEALQ